MRGRWWRSLIISVIVFIHTYWDTLMTLSPKHSLKLWDDHVLYYTVKYAAPTLNDDGTKDYKLLGKQQFNLLGCEAILASSVNDLTSDDDYKRGRAEKMIELLQANIDTLNWVITTVACGSTGSWTSKAGKWRLDVKHSPKGLNAIVTPLVDAYAEFDDEFC